MLPFDVAQSSCADTAIYCVCTSGFMDDVMFSHNGANGAESIRQCYFGRVRLVAAPVGGRACLPGATSASSDCLAMLTVDRRNTNITLLSWSRRWTQDRIMISGFLDTSSGAHPN